MSTHIHILGHLRRVPQGILDDEYSHKASDHYGTLGDWVWCFCTAATGRIYGQIPSESTPEAIYKARRCPLHTLIAHHL